jgi:hypothetical protein
MSEIAAAMAHVRAKGISDSRIKAFMMTLRAELLVR